MAKKHISVQSRNENFTSRTQTQIWKEVPTRQNPYLAKECRCCGYDLMDLMQKRSLVDVIYLLFLGELPTKEQSKLLQTLMIAFINPGPRHPGTRAAMNAGIGRTNTAHILPISLSVLGGNHNGGGEVTAAMRFLLKHLDKTPQSVAKELLIKKDTTPKGDLHIAPGFGSQYGGIDPLPQEIASSLLVIPAAGKALQWCNSFAQTIRSHGMGWLSTGVCAAVFSDLNIPPRSGAGLFQLISAPGVLAHGLELANKPITAMPFLDEEHYVIQRDE